MDAPALALSDRQMPEVRRLSRLPIYIAIGSVLCVLALTVYGLSSRGIIFSSQPADARPGTPASRDADQLKRGIPDAIIGEPSPKVGPIAPPVTEPLILPDAPPIDTSNARISADNWRQNLDREQQEQWLREEHRQRMARLQADGAARNSPIAVEAAKTSISQRDLSDEMRGSTSASSALSSLRPFASGSDPTSRNGSFGQAGKSAVLDANPADAGSSQSQGLPPSSPFELKRGSVIPATLMTGINSDLPGRIIAQVSQHVYDSATGRHVLIPQGARLLGRYDANVSFGQERVLVIWSDIVLPDGSTLEIDAMPGVDSTGSAGFADKVDHHYLRTFGSAVLLALIGAGTESFAPQDTGRNTSFGDRAGRSVADSFGRLSEQTISKTLDVQPTIEIRAGYSFNVLVDQDLRFPSAVKL